MRGGKRPGAGRKAQGATRVTLSMRVLPTTKALLVDKAKEASLSVGQYVDKIMSE
ncbi:MAG: hypothetical protein J5732_00815 [Bacteroidaceae bacterium]|nr:hypothetical protein [Bacteroidaceae bacterium]